MYYHLQRYSATCFGFLGAIIRLLIAYHHSKKIGLMNSHATSVCLRIAFSTSEQDERFLR
jgi:hypothetical protein